MNTSDDTKVVFGATSAVGQAVIRSLAGNKANLYLVARDSEKLAIVVQDAQARGANVTGSLVQDLADIEKLEGVTDQIIAEAGRIDSWFFFQGVLPEQTELEKDWTVFDESLRANFTGVARLLHDISNYLVNKSPDGAKSRIVVVSSVAGLRGRKSNYGYGTPKGALLVLMSGLRGRLASGGHTVTAVLPGFIRSPMTAHLDTTGGLWAEPEKVASDILKAADSGKSLIYTPWIWRWIMLVIRAIPETIFKRLNI